MYIISGIVVQFSPPLIVPLFLSLRGLLPMMDVIVTLLTDRDQVAPCQRQVRTLSYCLNVMNRCSRCHQSPLSADLALIVLLPEYRLPQTPPCVRLVEVLKMMLTNEIRYPPAQFIR